MVMHFLWSLLFFGREKQLIVFLLSVRLLMVSAVSLEIMFVSTAVLKCFVFQISFCKSLVLKK